MKIILDTNALMAVGEFGVDVFRQLEHDLLYVLSGTIEELEKIQENQKGKHKRNAQVALSLLQRKSVKVLQSSGHVDDVLVEYSTKGYHILTQDLGLKRRLQKPYLTIRQKKRVVEVR